MINKILNQSDIDIIVKEFNEDIKQLELTFDDNNVECINSQNFKYFILRVGTTKYYYKKIFNNDKEKIDHAILSEINGTKEMFNVFDDIAAFFKIHEDGNSYKYLKTDNMMVCQIKITNK